MCTQVAQTIVTITFVLLIQFLIHGQGFEHQVKIIVKGKTYRSYFFLGRTGRTLDQQNYLEVIERPGSYYIEKDSEKEIKKKGSVLGKIVARMDNRLKTGRQSNTRCWVNMGNALPNVNGLNCVDGWFMLYGASFSAITTDGKQEYRMKIPYSWFFRNEKEIEKCKSEVAALTSSSSRHGDTKKQKVNTNSKEWISVSEDVEGSEIPQPERGQILNLQVMFRPERDDRFPTIEVPGELLLVSDQQIGNPQQLEPSWTNNLILRINPELQFKFRDGVISQQDAGNYHIFIRVVENTAKPELPTTDQPAPPQPFDVANTEWQRIVIFAMFCNDNKAIGFNVAICSNTIKVLMQIVPVKPKLRKDTTWILAEGTLNEMERTMVLGQPVDCKGEGWVPIGTWCVYLRKPDVWSRRYGTEVAVKSTFVFHHHYNGNSIDLDWSAEMKLDLSGVLDTPEIKVNYSFI